MDNIERLFGKYKYYIGGSSLLLIIFYAIYEYYSDKENNKAVKDANIPLNVE